MLVGVLISDWASSLALRLQQPRASGLPHVGTCSVMLMLKLVKSSLGGSVGRDLLAAGDEGDDNDDGDDTVLVSFASQPAVDVVGAC